MASPLAALLSRGQAVLSAAGIESARLDAEVLLAHVLGLDRGRLLAMAAGGASAAVPEQAAAAFDALLARRCRREPIAYLTGVKEFWSLDFEAGPGVLVPRPDTELVVAASLDRISPQASARLLDVGTGTGAIAIALAVERPRARAVATDVSRPALAMARRNAARHGVAGRISFVLMDLASGLAPRGEGAFDLVASNPPYIALHERESLMPDVRDHEPAGALMGGLTGMETIERLIPEAARVLRPGGWLVMEMASERAAATRALLRGPLWQDAAVHDDLAGLPRVVSARRTR